MTPAEADLLGSAIAYAAAAHSGQYRKFSGDPYIVHPLRVMAAVQDRSIFARIAAVLHDVVEDTGVSLSRVQDLFGDEVSVLVDALTSRYGETYADFITRVANSGPDAIAIKVADLRDNLDGLGRLDDPSLRKRYIKALLVLA